MRTHPDYASDATSLGEAMARFEAEGFGGQFGVRDAGRLVCFGCRQEHDAAEVELVGLFRTEGASDPDDMVALAALVCPGCGALGTVALKYGPEAPAEESDVLALLDDVRTGDGTHPST